MKWQRFHAVAFRTIAEGVEDEPTRTALANLGCAHAQGYYIGKPRPAAEIPAVEGIQHRV